MSVPGVSRPAQTERLAAARRTKRAEGASFALSPEPQSADMAAQTGPAPQIAPLAQVDAVLALQGGGEARDGDRRERARAHALAVLDQLDALQLSVLAGQGEAQAVSKLRQIAEQGPVNSGDSTLDGLVRQVAVRAAVELAKREDGDVAAPTGDPSVASQRYPQIAETALPSIYQHTSRSAEEGDRS